MTIAVSSWALHRTIGVTYPDSPSAGRLEASQHSDQPLPLTELPAALKTRGYDRLELCHFHLPAGDDVQVAAFRHALSENAVHLQSLLIDDGDLSNPETSDRDADWIEGWLDVASRLGAERARIIAGKQAYSDEAFELAASQIERLAERAEGLGLRLTTENWFPLLSTPSAVNGMLDRLEGKLGLCGDFGNWPAPSKYEDFPLIFSRAETCHAKCEFIDADHIDLDDYNRCLAISEAAGFSGAYTLVNGGPANEWHALSLTRSAISDSRPQEV
ncbi:MAG TPA: TIM barrel protein [Fimbriimonas sp.]|nr:TIM barrel protein [Fimbriimonas sp.]